MTPERHQRVCDLVYQALELPEGERETFLSRQCSSDATMRQEVDSLLRSSDDVRATFLRSSTLRLTLNPGIQIDDYKVESLLGSGGMGEVYRARDLKLARDVAIKVLPSYFSSDPKRLSRFEQEARAAAALNHPNILAVYQLGEYNGAPYLVSELLEGETLRGKISRERVPASAAIDFAAQIGTGLAAAHEKGIVHRDLKPENLFVTPDGRVKILDFGLAKLTQSSFGLGQNADDFHRGGELVTETGVVMGTIGYMSPEQARGQPADARSDIFALGAVLYEMLTGARAFQRNSAADTISAILHEQPPALSGMVRGVPIALQKIVQRCLDKNPDRRFQSASDLVRQLETLPTARDRAPMMKAAAVLAVLIVGIAIFRSGGFTKVAQEISRFFSYHSPPPQPRESNLTANAEDNPVRAAAISRDGKYVAYVDNSKKVALLLVDSGDVRQLPLDSTFEPLDWFPDGVHLLVLRSGEKSGLWTFSTWDSSLHKIWDGQTNNVAISPDGSSIALVKGPESREIWLLGPGGEDPHKIFQLDSPDSIWSLAWSQKGRRLAYLRVRGAFAEHESAIETVDTRGGGRTVVLSEPLLLGRNGIVGLTWLADDRLIYGLSSRADGCTFFSMVVDSASGERVGQSKLMTDWGTYFVPNVQASANGKRLIALKQDSEDGIYVGSLASGKEAFHAKRLLQDRWQNFATTWMPDSKSILLTSKRNGRFAIYRQDLNGDAPETLIAGPENYRGPVMSAGGTLLYTASSPSDGETSAPNSQLMSTRIEGGPRSLLMKGLYSYNCGSRPSSGCVVGETKGNQLILSNLDAVKGKGEEIARIDYEGTEVYWSLSPDASRVAIAQAADKNGLIRVLDLKSGKIARLRIRGWRWQGFNDVCWATDDVGLFAITVSLTSLALVSVAPDGKTKVLHEVDPEQAPWLGLPVASPDGRFLAFTETVSTSDLVMLENF